MVHHRLAQVSWLRCEVAQETRDGPEAEDLLSELLVDAERTRIRLRSPGDAKPSKVSQ